MYFHDEVQEQYMPNIDVRKVPGCLCTCQSVCLKKKRNPHPDLIGWVDENVFLRFYGVQYHWW